MSGDDRMVDAYPLRWPEGRRRTPAHKRIRGGFGRATKRGTFDDAQRFRRQLSIAEARSRLMDELDRLGAIYWTLSSNLRVRMDGLPYSNQAEPEDRGVALYFQIADRSYCLACDRYDRAADNIAAIAAHVDALRGIERWGVGSVEEAFAGARFALPDGVGPSWASVLGPCASRAEARAAYRERAKRAHPDQGGSDEAMHALSKALDAALRVLPEVPAKL